MPSNKHAVIRFNVIDRCLTNTGRKWTKKDIKKEIESKLEEIDPKSNGISQRTLDSDFEFLKSEEGYSAPIVMYRENGNYYYKYDEIGFSINQSPLSIVDLTHIQTAMSVFQRFEGKPGFDWMRELNFRLKSHLEYDEDQSAVVGYESNEEYSGNIYIADMFNAIQNKTVLSLEYASFEGNKFEFDFHPHYLKQFNSRWFIFGFNQTNDSTEWNVPLDRIISSKQTDIDYVPSETDWELYFKDIVGVTKPINSEVEMVELLFAKRRAPYVITKPIHDSQRLPKVQNDGSVIISIKVIINKELISRILSFGDEVQVLAPLSLREELKGVSGNMNNHYQ